jgi:hypothetical protein
VITAKEARGLVERSEAAVQNVLEKLDAPIKAAAKSGAALLVLSDVVGMPYDKISIDAGPYDSVEVSPFMKVLIEKLKALGYGATLEKLGNAYVPRGLAVDDVDGFQPGPLYQHYAIVIRW